MNTCANLNNTGASQLVSGMYRDAVESFTCSLRIVKNALAVLAAEKQQQMQQDANRMDCSPIASTVPETPQDPRRCAVVTMDQEQVAAASAFVSMDTEEQPLDCEYVAHRGLYISPLFLSTSASYDRYEVTVEASVAIMFNLALSHHLNALYGSTCGPKSAFSQSEASTPGVSTLEQAISLYELAYTVQMQEDAQLNVEFTMAIINNLGHIHRLMGDEEKATKCFGHLLSTMLFLQSCGGGQSANTSSCHTDTFLYSISHLILKDAAAPAA
ncbi:MAG: hypothetical protein SGILL_000732 [Bacillariaceae sp.]